MTAPQPLRGPLVGMLASPCGVWVQVKKMGAHGVWGRPLREMTRRGVLGALA